MGMVALAPLAHAQLSVTLLANMSFGSMEYTNPIMGDLTLGSDGGLTYPPSLNGNGVGTAGQVRIGGTPGDTVSIACDTNATLTHTASGGLTLGPIVLSVGGGAAYGAGLPCSGLGTPTTTHVISASTNDNVVYIGARLQTNGASLSSGMYDTMNGGGASFALRVLVI